MKDSDLIRRSDAPLKSDTLLDPKILHLVPCCGREPIVHQFTKLHLWGIECGQNGHFHNTGLCNSLEDAVKRWNEGTMAGKRPGEDWHIER